MKTICFFTRKVRQYRLYKWVLVLIPCILVLIALTFSNRVTASYTMNPNKIKCFKSIQIQEGDTLWDIAKEYKTDDWESIHDLISEIKSFNSLTSDYIYTGYYIAVPYYVY